MFGVLVLSIASAFTAHGHTLPLSVYPAAIFHVHVLLSCSTHSVLVSCFPLEKQMPPVVCCVFRIAISNLISLGMGGLSVTQIFATGLHNHMIWHTLLWYTQICWSFQCTEFMYVQKITYIKSPGCSHTLQLILAMNCTLRQEKNWHIRRPDTVCFVFIWCLF